MGQLGTVFRTPKGKCFYYDAITNKIFENIQDAAVKNEPVNLLNAVKDGVLGHNGIEELQYTFQFDEYINALDNSLDHMILGLTEDCNLRCEYCTYSGHYKYTRNHSSETMTFETAARAVSFLKEHSGNSEHVAISFYGGEPLLCFRQIVKIVEFAETQFKDKPHHYQITTNGTLMQEEFIIWFSEHKNVFINITLNGDAKSHDRFRKYPGGMGSHQHIMANINQLISACGTEDFSRINFLCNYIDLADFESIMDFYENNVLLKEKVPILINQVNPFDNDGFLEKYNLPPDNKDIKNSLLRKYLAELNTAGDNITFCKAFFDKRLYKIHMREMVPIHKRAYYLGVCRPFLTRLFVNTKGEFQICEKVQLSFDFGNVFSGFKLGEITELLEEYKKHNTDCQNCWAIRMCQACFYNTFTNEGFKEKRRYDMCRSIKNNLLENLATYCEIMDDNEDLLSHLERYEFPVKK